VPSRVLGAVDVGTHGTVQTHGIKCRTGYVTAKRRRGSDLAHG